MTNDDFDYILKQIVGNRFLEVFETLEKVSEVKSTIMQLHTMFNRLNSNQMNLIVSQSDYDAGLAQITKHLITIVTELKKSLNKTEEQKVAGITERTQTTEMYQTISNNNEKGNYQNLAQTALTIVLGQIQEIQKKLTELPMNHEYLPSSTRLLVELEKAFSVFKKHLFDTSNENTPLDSKLKAAQTKTKEALKEIATARKNFATSEANDYIRSQVIPYSMVVMENLALEIDKIIMSNHYKFSTN